MRIFLTLIILIIFTLQAGWAAQGNKAIRVWPGKAPDEPAGIEVKKAEAVTGSDGVIRIPYVDTPELIHFPADPKKATGTCVIVCPGGGYGKLAWNKEGTEIATWLNTLGVEAVALKYRVPRRDRENPYRICNVRFVWFAPKRLNGRSTLSESASWDLVLGAIWRSCLLLIRMKIPISPLMLSINWMCGLILWC